MAEQTTQAAPDAGPVTKGDTVMTDASPLVNGVKAAAEAFLLPGSSLIADGNINQGALHVAGGIAAKMILGPIAMLAVGANSYSKSVTGLHLHEHFMNKKSTEQPASAKPQAAS